MGDDKDDNNADESSSRGTKLSSVIAESTYFKSSNFYGNDDDDDSSTDFLPLVDNMRSNTHSKNEETTGSTQRKAPRRKKKSKKNSQQRLKSPRAQNFPPPSLQPKKSAPLRAILLALSLALILAAFWILDSLKDPMFAILVGGELGKHQPRAKMVSVCMTLILVCTVEFVSHERRKKRKQEEELRKQDEDVLDGGGKWTKMSIGTSYENPIQTDEIKQKQDDAAIPVGIFSMLGLGYAALFALAAYALSHHSSFVVLKTAEATPPSSAWRTLGYALYAAVESYGSLTVAAFWSFSNSNLTLATAEENYGLIIAAAQLGAIGGSTIVAMARSGSSTSSLKQHKWYEWDFWSFKHQWSVPSLVLLGCGIMVLQVFLMRVYGALFPLPMHEEVDCETEEEDYRPVVSKPDAASSHHHHQSSMHDVSICASSTGSARQRSKKKSKSTVKKTGEKEKDGIGAFMSGVLIILRYNYVLLILGVSCLFEVSLTCLDYEMKLIGWDKFGDGDISDGLVNELPSPHISAGDTSQFEGDVDGYYNADGGGIGGGNDNESTTTFAQFMGHYGQMTNALSLLLSYFAFPYLMTKFGLRRTLRLFPTLLVFVTVLTYLAVPFNLPVLFFSMSLLKAMTYSINDPAKELLYMPTSNTVKFKAKFWIDVVGARIAKAVGSSINNYAGSVERIVQYGTVPSLVTAIMLYMACLKAGEQFESLIQRGEIVGWEEDEDNGETLLDDGEDNEGDDEDDTYEKGGLIDHSTHDLDERGTGWESDSS
uniref:ADP,ATP carrier protein n=1 Tax=Helicotheca tamesis TaxID=374047 RepID=A0A7S2HNJ0_9STRA|mmetsp:Transcript_19605/g.26916  ORF Transcript_19605/g.26916 Transcript_19605/m.26916 type:complete len:767 (+) Transcript_19605:107-2407(+)